MENSHKKFLKFLIALFNILSSCTCVPRFLNSRPVVEPSGRILAGFEIRPRDGSPCCPRSAAPFAERRIWNCKLTDQANLSLQLSTCLPMERYIQYILVFKENFRPKRALLFDFPYIDLFGLITKYCSCLRSFLYANLNIVVINLIS